MKFRLLTLLAGLAFVAGCGGESVDITRGTSTFSGAARTCTVTAADVPDDVRAASPLTETALPSDTTVTTTRFTADGDAVVEGWSRTRVEQVVEDATLAVLAAGGRVDRVEAEPREGFVAFTTPAGPGSFVVGQARCPNDATGFVLTVPPRSQSP